MPESNAMAFGSNDNGKPSKADWRSLVAQLQTVEAIPSDETTDEHIDLAGHLTDAIMAMPSPDARALLWKLDYFLAPDAGGSTGSYSAAFVAQTVADYRHLLGGG